MADSNFTASAGEWNVDANWSSGVPPQTGTAEISNGGTATVSGSDNPTVGGISVTNGTLNVSGQINVGTTAIGGTTFTLSSGIGNINIDGGALISGQFVSSLNGTIDVSNSGTFQFNSYNADSTASVVNFQSAGSFQDEYQYNGSVQGFQSGDNISFNGSVNSLSYSGNSLSVSTTNGNYSLNFIGNYSQGNFAVSSGVITYQDLPPAQTYSISAAAADVTEGTPPSAGNSVVFTVSRLDATNASTIPISFSGTAIGGGNDYAVSGLDASGNLAFAANDLIATFTVTTTSDAVFEPNETVRAALGTPSDGGTVGTPATATLDINNDDVAPVFSIANAPTVTEGGQLSYAVTRTGDAQESESVTVATSDGTATAGQDYTAKTQVLTFDSGVTTANFVVNTTDDGLYEGSTPETVTATLSAATGGSTISTSNGSATGGIADNDTAPVFSIADAPTVTEGGQLSYAVTRTGDAQESESVTVATSDGTATAGQDYTAKTQVLTFDSGATTTNFVVNTTDDALFEGSTPETVTATLSTATGGSTISTTNGSASGGIADNDTAPTLAIGPTNVAIAEGNTGTTPFAFTVTRTGDAQADQTVNYAVTGSGGSPAAADDFAGGTLPTGTVTFLVGDATQTVTIPVKGDTAYEGTDGFTVTLFGSNFGAITQATATGSIVNDDAAPDPGPAVSTSPSAGPDIISGAPGNDTIAGQGGDDTIQGSDGNDLLLGNQGNDAIRAGDGMNTASGGMGNDQITVGNGSDLLYGNEGADTIQAGNGNNTIVGGSGNAAIDSVDGSDVITSGSGNDLILGNGGDDTVASGGGSDSVSGGLGQDFILGNQGDDVLLGNQGDDTISGGQGADTISGGMGNDVLYGNQGDDVLYGNEGLNTFVFAPGDTDFRSGQGTGDTVADFTTGLDRIDFGSGPVGTSSNFGAASTTSTDFASIQAAAQVLLNGGDTFAFVADGVDGYLFTTGGSGTAITDAVKLAGAGTVGAVKYTDIAHGPPA